VKVFNEEGKKAVSSIDIPALRENSTRPATHAAFLKTTNSVRVAAMR
jgi:hypothetical protein